MRRFHHPLHYILLLVLLAACAPAAPATSPTVAPTLTLSAIDTSSATPPPPATPTTLPPAPTAESTRTMRPTTAADASAFTGSRRLGRGVNLGNALEAPSEGAWGVTLEAGYFKTIKDGGFDSVRIPINWIAHSQPTAPYTIDPAFFARVDWAIKQALQNKLVVVINMHSFDALMESPVKNQAQFAALWGQIAAHYATAPDDLYFELLNEPNGELSGTNAWNGVLAAALKEVRKSNPKRMVVIGPGGWYSIPNLYDLQLPAADRNIIVTIHYYQPFHFTHQGAEWAAGSQEWMGTTWTGTAEQKSAIDGDFNLAVQWSQLNARPIYLGEFGAYSKAPMDSRHAWTTYIARQAEARGFSWAYWEFCAGFGVFDKVKKAWVEPIYTALIP